VGRASDEMRAAYFKSAHIYCSPATGKESFGIVLLEARATGKPVVASDIEGYRGVLTDGEEGLLFRNKNVDSLAASLETLIRNPEMRQAMGQRGRATADKHRWQVVAGRVEAYYASCIQEVHAAAGQRTA